MEQQPASPRDVAIPAVALHSLRAALLDEVEPLVVTRALHEAGIAAGIEFFRGFEGALETPEARDLPQPLFWEKLGRYFKRCGWGSVEHRELHTALGSLRSSDWAEAGESVPEQDVGCWFSSGLLAGILGEIAEGDVSVLEVECRGRGDEACHFVYGSESAIDELYERLTRNQTLDEALENL